jgi:hypothetical protein
MPPEWLSVNCRANEVRLRRHGNTIREPELTIATRRLNDVIIAAVKSVTAITFLHATRIGAVANLVREERVPPLLLHAMTDDAVMQPRTTTLQ